MKPTFPSRVGLPAWLPPLRNLTALLLSLGPLTDRHLEVGYYDGAVKRLCPPFSAAGQQGEHPRNSTPVDPQHATGHGVHLDEIALASGPGMSLRGVCFLGGESST